MKKKRLRELQPPHPAENITYEEALRIWRLLKVEEEAEAKRQQEAANGGGGEPAGSSPP